MPSHTPQYIPTPAEIEEAAERIRAGWTDDERKLRAAYMPDRRGHAPELVDALALRPPVYHVSNGPRGVEIELGTPLPEIELRGGDRERGGPEEADE